MATQDAAVPLAGDLEKGVEMTSPVEGAAAGTAAGTAAGKGGPPPENVKLKGPNGEESDVKLVPNLPFGLAPPGGWYGPFGMFRIIVIAFCVLIFLGLIVWVWAAISLNWLGVALRWLLVPGAAVAAFAAYSHEGLANEVSAVAKENDSFSSKNDMFQKQLKDMSSISDKLAEFAGQGEEHVKKLEHVLEGIERVGDLGKVNTILRGFTDAEMKSFMYSGGTERGNRVLDNIDELSSFIDGTTEVLQHNIDTFSVKEFKRAGRRGIGLTTIALLTACACTEDKEESICFLSFVYFVLDPKGENRQSKCSECLEKHMKGTTGKFTTKAAIDAELAKMVAATAKDGPVAETDAENLVLAVLNVRKGQVEDNEDDV